MKGSGKSQLCVNLLLTAWKHIYDTIFIISPTFEYQYTSGGVWSKLSSEGITVYPQVSTELIEELMTKAIKSASEKKQILVIFDDNGSDLRNSKICSESVVNKLISNSRHCNMSLVFLSQRLSQNLPIVRAQTDTYIFFGTSSYAEKDLLYRQVSVLPRKEFFQMIHKATEKPYSFLVCEMNGGVMQYFLSDFKTKAN